METISNKAENSNNENVITGCEGVEAMVDNFKQQRTPEYKRNKDGDVMFSKIGDEITFG